MILIFDLDDTLYDESTYVRSGFRAVAKFGEQRFGWNEDESYSHMKKLLLENGRGFIFDDWLKSHSRHSKSLVEACLRIYRHHEPTIKIRKETRILLESFQAKYPLYIVTDGHKVVQKKKVDALNIDYLFKRVYITHRFGIHNAKPSLHCFNLIKSAERVEWEEMVYVGDNPTKDFINLNRAGAKTIRVLTGTYSDMHALPNYDAQISIPNLQTLNSNMLNEIGNCDLYRSSINSK